MKTKLDIYVGVSLKDSKRRILKAVDRARRGKTVFENHLTFENWDTLVQVMSAKRLELLRALHRRPAKSIRSLALRLRRDYKRVHSDVTALASIGLIGREANTLSANYDEIRTNISLSLFLKPLECGNCLT